MKAPFLHLLLLFSVFSSAYGQQESQTVFAQLDKMLEKQSYYTALKQAQIDSLKQRLNDNRLSSEQQYMLCREICVEYKPYISDSSMAYAARCSQIARRLGNKPWEDEAAMRTILALVTRCMYKEAIEIQETINRATLPDSLLPLWYQCGQHLNHSLALYTRQSPYSSSYTVLDHAYEDSLCAVYPPQSVESRYNQSKRLFIEKKYVEAEHILLQLMKEVPESSRSLGAIAFTLADVYRKQGNTENYRKYIAQAAICDIRTATKENAAMYSLAMYFYAENDIKRAYKYIMHSLEDAVFCNAQLRTSRISHILPLISDAHKLQEAQHKNLLFSLMLATSLFSCFLIIAVFIGYKQMKKLSIAKKKLNDANQLKEEYIKHFLYLCSAYIGRLHHFRRTVNRKITTNQINELLKITKSPDITESEQKEFYTQFDQAFIHLYPNFVEAFNKLLQPQERFILKPGELLNNEIRIFALIRLGIDDSSKIASFLHYSINTIYTYRNRVKNKAIDRENFEAQVMRIGKG